MIHSRRITVCMNGATFSFLNMPMSLIIWSEVLVEVLRVCLSLSWNEGGSFALSPCFDVSAGLVSGMSQRFV